MLNNIPIRLQVSNREDSTLPLFFSGLLIVLAALLSAHPLFLAAGAILLVGAGWVAKTLQFPKTKSEELTSVIFPDGRVRLESNQEDTIDAFLDGQQWCTRWLAVVRVTNGDKIRKLVIRSAKQPTADDFRRLNMWLRQDFCNSNGLTGVGKLTRLTGSE